MRLSLRTPTRTPAAYTELLVAHIAPIQLERSSDLYRSCFLLVKALIVITIEHSRSESHSNTESHPLSIVQCARHPHSCVELLRSGLSSILFCLSTSDSLQTYALSASASSPLVCACCCPSLPLSSSFSLFSLSLSLSLSLSPHDSSVCTVLFVFPLVALYSRLAGRSYTLLELNCSLNLLYFQLCCLLLFTRT